VIGAIRSFEHHLPVGFGSAFLTEDPAEAVPAEMARLLAWHGLEELEHRGVADVRAAGDAPEPASDDPAPRWSSGALVGMTARLLRLMSTHVADCLRPGFHPDQMVEPAEMAQWIERLEPAPD
jgi:predicted metal-dependent hydrolase